MQGGVENLFVTSTISHTLVTNGSKQTTCPSVDLSFHEGNNETNSRELTIKIEIQNETKKLSVDEDSKKNNPVNVQEKGEIKI